MGAETSKSWIHNNPEAKQGRQMKAELCNHMQAPGDSAATLHKPAFLGFNRWHAGIVSRLTLPKS